MIFHENRLLADDSHEYHTLFFQKLGKMSQNVSSAAVVIDALGVKRGSKQKLPNSLVLMTMTIMVIKSADSDEMLVLLKNSAVIRHTNKNH